MAEKAIKISRYQVTKILNNQFTSKNDNPKRSTLKAKPHTLHLKRSTLDQPFASAANTLQLEIVSTVILKATDD